MKKTLLSIIIACFDIVIDTNLLKIKHPTFQKLISDFSSSLIQHAPLIIQFEVHPCPFCRKYEGVPFVVLFRSLRKPYFRAWKQR